VMVMVVSPDGRTALSGDGGGALLLWDVAPVSPTFGQPLQYYPPESESECQWSLAFSPDGSQLLIGTTGGLVLVRDVATGDIIHRLLGHSFRVEVVAISPDGRYGVSGAFDSRVILWDLETGTQVREFMGNANPPASLVFSPDGQTVFCGTYGEGVTVWDVATGEMIRHYDQAVTGFWPSSDGRSFFTATGPTEGTLWRIDSDAELLAWTFENRYERDLTCDERAAYQIEPLCDADGNLPESAAYPPDLPPVPSTTAPAINVVQTTSVTPQTPSRPVLTAQIGENRGSVAVGASQLWTYDGQANEALNIGVYADNPANGTTPGEGESLPEGMFEPMMTVVAPDGLLLTAFHFDDDVKSDVASNVLIEGLWLPIDGQYTIVVSGYQFLSGGNYTLDIEEGSIDWHFLKKLENAPSADRASGG
ncbi:MAG: hypothetical protein GYB65_19110, partial [Chloroflexi bacterium]|nr:hypothetical protein [Chloroflexota bacterium]